MYTSLKSKVWYGFMILSVMFTGIIWANPADAACSINNTLKVGSRGADVQCLQSYLGINIDGSFGIMTKNAVISFQINHGLKGDGVVGPMTINTILQGASEATNIEPGNFPVGCASTIGYSPLTGIKCDTVSSSNTTTDSSNPSNNSNSSGLKGGAGDLDISSTSTDVEDSVKENEKEVKILGFKVKPDGSDVKLTSLKLTLSNEDEASSDNIRKYIDKVTVMLDNQKIGSANISDFSKKSGSPDKFSKSITLSDAVVKENQEKKIYIAISAISSINTDDMDTAVLRAIADSIRYEDATGAVLTADIDESNEFSFKDSSSDDQLDIQASTSNPDDTSIQVNETKNSDEHLALIFKLETDEDSGDVMVTSLPVTVDFTNYDVNGDDTVDAADDSSSDSAAEKIIDSVVIKFGKKEFEADLDSVNIAEGTGSATYIADIDRDEFTIDSGDTEEVKVYVSFKKQKNNYNEGVTAQLSVNPDDIEAETEDDDIDEVGGSTKTGALLTLRLNGADFKFESQSATTSGRNDTIGTFKIKFTAKAFGDTIQIPKSGTTINYEIRNANDNTVYANSSNAALTSQGARTVRNNVDSAQSFLVNDEQSFTATVTTNNTDVASGQYYLVITGINFYPNETGTLIENSVNDNFQTEPIYLSA